MLCVATDTGKHRTGKLRPALHVPVVLLEVGSTECLGSFRVTQICERLVAVRPCIYLSACVESGHREVYAERTCGDRLQLG